ncbi:MAG: histidine--tRNA ligase [Planctomycetes bacterium]|jgi:histidyl-tRNA synthetase|nr:histidine--tRNA ligase [Planctomycetota bacterium]
MKIPPVKGTRDFYPAQMARRNGIIDGWKKVSIRNGFEEYDGPIFEYLTMYQIKSGQEIVEQLFSLQDRGGRELAIRPEITPTLARMVNQTINSLPRPIKWFAVPRLCRAERPQKGRLREFFQWNIDIIGENLGQADAEVIFTALDYLRMVGLTSKDIQAKISSRKLLAAVLTDIGIPPEKLDSLYAVLDKKAKLPAEAFEAVLAEQVPDRNQAKKVLDFMALDAIGQVREVAGTNETIMDAVRDVEKIFAMLEWMGVGEYCRFDPSVVRGLAYYTGMVFEVHDIAGELRAICGGGRYDNLLRDFGGPPIPATGMGMGDVVLEILLQERGLLEKQAIKPPLEYFVTFAEQLLGSDMYRLAAAIRSRGHSANFSYRQGGLSKQLKDATAQGARKCIIIGQEYVERRQLVIKDMATGVQESIDVEQFLSRLSS